MNRFEKAGIYFIIVIVFTLVSFSSYGQDRQEKTNAIINKMNLIENQRALLEFQIKPLKYQATGSDSIRINELEELLTDDEILKRISTAFYKIFDEKEINDLYQFIQSSAYEKSFRSKETYKIINSKFSDINDEIERITNNLTETENNSNDIIELIEHPVEEFKPIPTDRENGFYETINYTDQTAYKNIKLKEKPSLTFDKISEVKKIYNSYTNQAEISIVLTDEGARKFYFLTKENIGKPIAIVISKEIVSLPIVNTQIIGGNVSISGKFSEKEIDDMINKIKKK